MAVQLLTPKLVVGAPDAPGTADAALDFYTAVLEAAVIARFAMGRSVVFAELELPGGQRLQVKDADSHDPGPPAGGGGVILDVITDDPDALATRAVDHGARVLIPMADQPYGSRQGRILDPFGHQWILGTPVSLAADEVQHRLDAWAEGTE